MLGLDNDAMSAFYDDAFSKSCNMKRPFTTASALVRAFFRGVFDTNFVCAPESSSSSNDRFGVGELDFAGEEV